MAKPEFVYVTYIATTPEAVWNALRDPERTKAFWGRHRNRSDWKVGSPWSHEDHETGQVDIVGKVIESDPPRRLVLTWASPEAPDEVSRVTFEIDEFFGSVRLRVTHEDLEAGSPMLKGVSVGWPVVLSSLKTLLETGSALPMTERRFEGPPPS